MASRYATRPGRPSVNSSMRHRGGRNESMNNEQPPPSQAQSQKQSSRLRTDRQPPRNRTDEDNEEEATVTAFPMWKTIGVVVVVMGCFAVVYPKMFHPMLLYALGYGQQQSQQNTMNEELFPHPSMKHSSAGAQRHPSFAGPSPQASRPSGQGSRGSPMPGMGPGMHPMGETGGKGGGKSMWHWMLPFYTVGVIVFLLYTLSKILWKKPKGDATRRKVNVRYNAERDRLETDEPEFAEDEPVEEEEVEEDESRMNGGVMSNRELRGLQRRLQDTEQTMHDILSQLEQLSTTADPGAAEQIKKVTLETLSNLGKLNTDRATSRRQQAESGFVATDRTNGGNMKFDATERRYLNDLQKALSEFKSFTENYIDEHSQKHPNGESSSEQHNERATTGEDGNVGGTGQPDESEAIIEEDDDHQEPSGSLETVDTGEDEIDMMEEDQGVSVEQLKVEEGVGELIDVGKEESKDGKGWQEAEEVEDEAEERQKKSKKHVRHRKGKRNVRLEE